MPDRDAAVAMVQRALGFGEPKPRWSHGGPGSGFVVTFTRPHPLLRQSPTLVELIEAESLDPARELGDVVPNVAGLAALQRDRPLKSHGLPIASSTVDELIDRVQRLGLRHWVQPSREGFPFKRLWMGIAADDLSGYDATVDGGLMIEVVDTATIGLPADAFTAPLAQVDDQFAGGMLRTAARCFLVADLAASLDAVARAFAWEPEAGPESGDDGSRRAILGFRLAESARVELLQPASTSEAGNFLSRHGPGIWSVRIAVRALDAKADDLRARGTPFRIEPTGIAQPEEVLIVEPFATPACRFEFATS